MARFQYQSVRAADQEPADSNFHREPTHSGEYGEHDRDAGERYKPVRDPVSRALPERELCEHRDVKQQETRERAKIDDGCKLID